MDTMYIEVRESGHLDRLKKAINYVNILNYENCLHVDFYYDFNVSAEVDLAEYDRIVEVLTSTKSYKKLTIGIDELHSKGLPPAFFSKLIKAMIEKQLCVNMFEVDLQYYGHAPKAY